MIPNCLRALALLAGLFSVLAADVLDPTFRATSNPVIRGPDGPVFATARHPDGRVVIAGDFARVNGQPAAGIARLLPDGSLDPAFAPAAGPDGVIRSVAALADGRVLVAGEFGKWGEQPAAGHLVRLRADGARDDSFVEVAGWEGSVTQIEVLPDGSFVVLGARREGDALRPVLQRRLAEGSLDEAFAPAVSDDSALNALAALADGGLLVAGRFTEFGGHTATNLVRLGQDGSVDATFAAPPAAEAGELFSVAVATDGRIAIGGAVTNFGPAMFLAVLTPEGMRDAGFATNSLGGSPVSRLAFEVTGRLLVVERWGGTTEFEIAGAFTPQGLRSGAAFSIARFGAAPLPLPDGGAVWAMAGTRDHDGHLRSWLIRTLPDGTPDPTFIPGVAGDALLPFQVRNFARLPDGDLVVPGRFLPPSGAAWLQELVRMADDGSVKAGFAVTLQQQLFSADNVSRLTVDKAGRLHVAGGFAAINGDTNHTLVARLRADGSVDPGFRHGFLSPDALQARGTIFHDLQLLGDGRFFAGGRVLLSSNVIDRELLVGRFLPDGSLDPAFKALRLSSTGGSGPTREVTALTAISMDRVLFWGRLQPFQPNGLLVHDAQGQTQAGPPLLGDQGLNPSVWQLARQRDGRLLVAGFFSRMGEAPRRNLARLLPDLTVDSTFDPGEGPNAGVSAIAELSDGRILVGGSFTRWNGEERRRLVLLEADGRLADGFDPGTGPNDVPLHFHEQPDGRVLMSGNFANFDGRGPARLARLVIPSATPPSPPMLVAQPQSTVVTNLTLPVALAAAAYGSGPLQWQWFRDGVALGEGNGFTGVHTAELLIAPGQLVAPASYHAEVANDFGRERSVNVIAGAGSGTVDHGFTTNLLTGQLRLRGFGNTGTKIGGLAADTAPDGQVRRVLIFGNFTQYEDAAVPGLVVVFPDGRRDETWTPPAGVTGPNTLKAAFLADGRLVLAGRFRRANGAPRDAVLRLLPEGTLDESFDPGDELLVTPPPGFPRHTATTALALRGEEVWLAEQSAQGAPDVFVRLLGGDGRTDTTFAATNLLFTGTLTLLALDRSVPDAILVGGRTPFGDALLVRTRSGASIQCRGVARLLHDGRLDPDFNASPNRPNISANGDINALIPLPEGGAMVAGTFTEFDGVPEPFIRVDGSGRADTNLMLRFPTPPPPHVPQQIFAAVPLGDDAYLLRVPQQTGGPDRFLRLRDDGLLTPTIGAPVNLLVPANATSPVNLLSLGDGSFLTVITLNSSTPGVGRFWLTELSAVPSASLPPRIFGSSGPLVHPVRSGFREPLLLSAAFQAGGETQFQWSFNGEPLPGETQPALRLVEPRPEDSGLYRLTISNPAGSVSVEMAVTVLDAPPEPPRLLTELQSGDRPLRLHFTPLPGQQYRLEISSDLKTWEPFLDPAAVLTETDFALELTDGFRFFRLVAEP